jgi:hypothetical protein
MRSLLVDKQGHGQGFVQTMVRINDGKNIELELGISIGILRTWRYLDSSR